MTDYFISYTGVDEGWAEWIGYVLEEQGFSTILQKWDFRPGSNFVLEMQRASQAAERTIMVLSPDYLQSQFASSEWASAFGRDPQGVERTLVPVMIRDCQPEGLLSSIVHIRIVGLAEDAARETLLKGLDQKRAKPAAKPAFPGVAAQVEQKAFPGPGGNAEAVPTPSAGQHRIVPKLKVAPSDMDKKNFVRSGFETIKKLFEDNAKAAPEENQRINIDLEVRTNVDLRVEIFVDGKSVSKGRVWLGGMHSDNNICYAEGQHFSENSCNEIIYLNQDDELYFSASMAMGFSGIEKTMDVKHMDADQMAEYLWQRLVARLQHQ